MMATVTQSMNELENEFIQEMMLKEESYDQNATF